MNQQGQRPADPASGWRDRPGGSVTGRVDGGRHESRSDPRAPHRRQHPRAGGENQPESNPRAPRENPEWREGERDGEKGGGRVRAYLRSAREGRSRAEDDDAGNSELARSLASLARAVAGRAIYRWVVNWLGRTSTG